MKTTETIYRCDGNPGSRDGGCGKVIGRGTGVVIRGDILSPSLSGTDAPTTLVAVSPGSETVLCMDCLRRRLHMREPEPRVVERVVEVSTYHDDYNTAGKGPTGPMAPPDLPRAVGVIAALCRVPRVGAEGQG